MAEKEKLRKATVEIETFQRKNEALKRKNITSREDVAPSYIDQA